ncbi:APC family permease [Arthrobacter sp. NIO-1057]|uniref:APC family permease n=1 Tax=Arthrobacter sp. NIO-1057 TaxID=993071 RepID=UPI00071CF16E|nr:APC family permease [Arthrobacter sp. NIO-1057]KSU64958.1 amino acid permease [Arthrobacter sp. NIO-1057]SCC49918.1 amino acid/polyamine/organocation transporter, APC superfamily (TC 2.A.3) [Arthrobacter sp. NIO-1057]
MTVDSDTPVPPSQDSELKRVIGPKLLLFLIMGDIVGAGIFAITGKVAGQVGGAAWLPFLVAFAIATLTAFSYLELVTKYPHAAGAALYVHKAFGVHFVTFIVAFTVACSGITSAATSATLVGQNLLIGFGQFIDGVPTTPQAGMWAAIAIIVILALINLRGVGESVKFNLVLTMVSLAIMAVIIGIGFAVIASGQGDVSRLVVFETPSDRGIFAAVTMGTAIAFFAMVGFEDSVNLVEETKNPNKIFPKIMLIGLGLCAVIYMLVAITVILVIPTGDLLNPKNPDAGILLDVVRIGAPNIPIDTIFPFVTVFAVVNTALMNMLMASRLLYGMARQGVLPQFLGKVHSTRRSPWVAILFSTALAIALVAYVNLDSENGIVGSLGGTTALLLLCVFAVVNVSLLVLRREKAPADAFRAPTIIPILGVVFCLFLAGPWARSRADWVQYEIAGLLLLIGVALWALTWLINRINYKKGIIETRPGDYK